MNKKQKKDLKWIYKIVDEMPYPTLKRWWLTLLRETKQKGKTDNARRSD